MTSDPEARWESDVLLADGRPAQLRPARAGDREALREFHARLSEDTVYFRYFSSKPRLSDRFVEAFTHVDPARHMVLFALTVGCTWARYGNERADRISAAELAAVREVYEIVPPGSRLVSANYNSPVGYRQWEQFDYASVGPDLVPAGLVGIRRDLTIGDPEASYLLITNSMRATSEMFGGTAPGGWDEIVAQIRSAPFLELVLDRPGAVLFRYVRGPT